VNAVRITFESLRLSSSQPSSWITWALLLFCWPLWFGMAPIGISSHFIDDWLIFYQIAIMTFALGVLRGIGTLARLSRSMVKLSSPPSLASLMLAVGSMGVLHALIASTPALMLGSLHPQTHEWGFALGFGFESLTIVALGTLLLRLDSMVGSAPWLLGMAILLSPLLLPDPLPARSLLLLPGALLSASWLLDHPPGRAT